MADIVEHERYGRGVVERSRGGGFELYVRFEDGLRRWVRFDEVRYLAEELSISRPGPPRPVLPRNKFRARRMIEAFRMGIVPQDMVEEFTFGREREIERITRWLEEGEDGALLIIGEYGSGKTHLLEYTKHIALKRGWAVSKVDLDPQEVSLHRPKRVYAEIASAFRYKEGNDIKSFRDFIRSVSGRGELRNHWYLCYEPEEDEAFWDWIEGRAVERSRRYPTLPDKFTTANIYCNIISGIGWAAKAMLGLKGFLILFDEAEAIESILETSYQRERTFNFLKGLLMLAEGDINLLYEEVEWDPWRRGFYGIDTGLQYYGMSRYVRLSYAWRIPCFVKVIFAFAPVEALYKPPLDEVERVEIEDLSGESLRSAFETICLIYAEAYDHMEGDASIEGLFEAVTDWEHGRTRRFIKAAVEALDLSRFKVREDGSD